MNNELPLTFVYPDEFGTSRGTSGSLAFTGTAKAFSDRYDANASNHRVVFDEKAKTALRQVGRVAQAQDYEIRITGELPINYSR